MAMNLAPVGNLIFVSYRRSDVAPHAVALKLEIEARLQAAHVFLDTNAIQGGTEWPATLQNALSAAKVVMPIFGSRWDVSVDGKRRIDDADDWVFRELSFALTHKPRSIIPVVVDGVRPPSRDLLPKQLGDLADIQAIRIDTNQWDATVGELIGALTNTFSLNARKSDIQYPPPSPVVEKTPPFPWETLVDQVLTGLPGWRIEFADVPGDRTRRRVLITKTYDCGTFENAIAFINTAAKLASDLDHHPRLENTWKNVSVSLTTFDAGHRVTFVDFKFARYLDREFSNARYG
jgi:pterin-4a-carbinolamine dehydratase